MKLIEDLAHLCFLKEKENLDDEISKIKQIYQETSSELKDYIDYFENFWVSKIKEKIIDYSDDDEILMRSNSYLENFHRQLIELFELLPIVPNWKVFIEVLKQLDKKFTNKLIDDELLGFTKKASPSFGKKYNPSIKKRPFNELDTIKECEDEQFKKPYLQRRKANELEVKDLFVDKKNKCIQWLEWQGSNCRYDSFITICTLSILPKLHYLKSITISNFPHLNLIDISEKLLKGDHFISNDLYSYFVSNKIDKSD